MLSGQFNSKTDSISEYKQRVSNLGNDFELGLFLHLTIKSIVWIILFFILAFLSGMLYLRYTPQVYESKAVLQINNENEATKILNVGDIAEGQNDIARSIELLRSKVFIIKALSTLPISVMYYAEGTFRENEHYKNSPYEVEAAVKDLAVYGVRFYIRFIDPNQGDIHYSLGGKNYNFKFTQGAWINTPHADLKVSIINFDVIRNQQSVLKENELFFLLYKVEDIAEWYRTRVQVRLLNDAARTIEISFRDYSATKAADIVMAMARKFIEYDMEKKGESSQKILTFLNDQISVVGERLRNAETSISSFKKDNKVSGAASLVDAGAARLNMLEDEMLNLELKENVLNEVAKNIEDKKDVDTYQLISLITGADVENVISSQISSLQNLLKQKEELLYEVTPTSEKIKSVEFQIGVQKKLLLESIRSIKDKLGVRKSSLAAKITELESKYYNLPSEEVEYSRLQRLFAINEKFYTMLLEKQTEFSISLAGNVSQHLVLNEALPSNEPISPQRSLVMLASMLGGLLVSLILVFVRYITFNEINSVNEINKLTKASVSVLGLVPKYKKDIPVSQLLVDKNPKSLIAEAFRSIRTNLQFISNEPGPKTAAVTSTISGEGKTFVAINLAGIIAYAGKKVIIVDLDMRKPKIHLGFGVENIKGVSTLLIGRDSMEDCIQKSSFENLDFITAGPIPPNPSELIISKQMEETIRKLKTMYDFIVLDTPPVGLVTDGISVIQQVDYPIYIFRSEYSKRQFVQNVDRLFNESHIKRISAILNGVDIDRKSYGYNYGYGYGYGYGHGYGYYDDRNIKTKKKSFWKRFF